MSESQHIERKTRQRSSLTHTNATPPAPQYSQTACLKEVQVRDAVGSRDAAQSILAPPPSPSRAQGPQLALKERKQLPSPAARPALQAGPMALDNWLPSLTCRSLDATSPAEPEQFKMACLEKVQVGYSQQAGKLAALGRGLCICHGLEGWVVDGEVWPKVSSVGHWRDEADQGPHSG